MGVIGKYDDLEPNAGGIWCPTKTTGLHPSQKTVEKWKQARINAQIKRGEETRAKIQECLDAGMHTGAEIAEAIGLHQTAVNVHLRKMRGPGKKGRPKRNV